MADIIDLNNERNQRAEPEPQFVRTDDYGRKLYTFLLEYEMGGRRWAAEIWAYDEADAEARVKGMKESLIVSGKLHSTVPA